MLTLYPNDFAEAIIPIIHGSHQHWNKTSPPGQCPYSKKETFISSELIYVEFRLPAFALFVRNFITHTLYIFTARSTPIITNQAKFPSSYI